MTLNYVVTVRNGLNGETEHEFSGEVSEKVRFNDYGDSYCYQQEHEKMSTFSTGTEIPEKRIRDAVSCAVFEAKAGEKIDSDSRATKMAKHQCEGEWDNMNVHQRLRQIDNCQRWIDLYDAAMEGEESSVH